MHVLARKYFFLPSMSKKSDMSSVRSRKGTLNSIHRELSANIAELVNTNHAEIGNLKKKINQGFFLVFMTGILTIRLIGLKNHIDKKEFHNPWWTASFATLSVQSVVNFTLWCVILYRARKEGIAELGPFMKKVSLFLTSLSIFHNVFSVVDGVVSLKDGASRTEISTLGIAILSAVCNTIFFVIAALALRKKTVRQDDDGKQALIATIGDLITAMSPLVA